MNYYLDFVLFVDKRFPVRPQMDPFRSTGRPAPAVHMSIGNLYSSVPPDRIGEESLLI